MFKTIIPMPKDRPIKAWSSHHREIIGRKMKGTIGCRTAIEIPRGWRLRINKIRDLMRNHPSVTEDKIRKNINNAFHQKGSSEWISQSDPNATTMHHTNTVMLTRLPIRMPRYSSIFELSLESITFTEVWFDSLIGGVGKSTLIFSCVSLCVLCASLREIPYVSRKGRKDQQSERISL